MFICLFLMIKLKYNFKTPKLQVKTPSYINPEFKPAPKSINFGTQPVKIEEHASSAESGKVRISPPYNSEPCLIAGQIVDISVIQASSLDGSQSTAVTLNL